ncbi:MAG TPA: ribulose-phosphate 3-epimerase [Coprothermobacter proteolyticus]|uniref:Ribulose-phosphate 3-epimerase n=1 Tax=Coprothermobacter proteolyticus (strain ATCC 35245 / DSM 5265 / OCM 4 / BT) TaxID=309798 RepID=B5Y7I5_COPPD|nr:ribulose-phosphate 3-epimerase [Coprothermobacter proteolyticus]ACI18147.1 ribulose-phosphate 3-epimerase [Coprothermobacter proteolyticus DSM 5265]HOA64657.1 ribulose-phosphate 3-epimerase [Coprothermobacter proteolyticus]HPZ44818.1 ribulose-phosphate 3-epimerase [Coprothermobacter proteolyticus]HQD07557.1 ribulose-phosphate 3-epimerase [Coprothermobacter proteolyticus]
MRKLVPSLLSADLWCLKDQLDVLKQYQVDTLHVDVMDGNFVPNISMGVPLVESLRKHSDFSLDVHLMIANPERFIETFREAGADLLTVHIEATYHIHRLIQQIRNVGCKAGVSLNPGTPLELIKPILHMVDLVLVMSVNPGFGGQDFLPETLSKVKMLHQWKQEREDYKYIVEVDGGINRSNVEQVLNAGAEWIVSGSGVFKGDLKTNLDQLNEILLKYN